MTNQKAVIGAMAMDLKRVALGLHRGSRNMANMFAIEVIKQKDIATDKQFPQYIKQICSNLVSATQDADLALMYSTILQNYSTKLESLK